MGPTWGLPGADRTQVGPMLAPWTLLSGSWHIEAETNGSTFAGGIYKFIFVYENCYIFIQIPDKFGPKGPINNKPSLVQIMAWHQTGDKPLVEPMMT